jgi:biopolymer transport protein ExbB/TolQ
LEPTTHQGFNIVEQLLNMTLMGTEWVLWLLIILSVVSIGIIFERFYYFTQHGGADPELVRSVINSLFDRDTASALKLAKEHSKSLEMAVIVEGINQLHHGPSAQEDCMRAYLLRQKKMLDRGLTVLATLGNNAPFIGLFGTVLGIIKAFNDLGLNPAGGATVVMAGISEALVATAVGLFVAIPAVVAFNYFQRLTKNVLTDSEAVLSSVVAASKATRES